MLVTVNSIVPSLTQQTVLSQTMNRNKALLFKIDSCQVFCYNDEKGTAGIEVEKFSSSAQDLRSA